MGLGAYASGDRALKSIQQQWLQISTSLHLRCFGKGLPTCFYEDLLPVLE